MSSSRCTSTVRDLAVVIPVYNHLSYAVRAVASLARTVDCLALIVDDMSTDFGEFRHRIIEAAGQNRIELLEQHQHIGMSSVLNIGLARAREVGARYTVCANSDVLFSPGWWEPLAAALEHYRFVGPVTNAPGHIPRQNVRGVTGPALYRKMTDHQANIDAVGAAVRKKGRTTGTQKLNGFCIAAETATWFECQDNGFIFDPALLDGNEDAVMARARAKGMVLGIVASSYVFHYRGVTRGLLHDRHSPTNMFVYRPRGRKT